MKTQELLSRLDKVKKTGSNRWIACCPSHDDKKPSLTITESNDKILLKCWSHGCGAGDIMSAIGMGLGDLFDKPLVKQPYERQRLHKKPFNAEDILEILGDEIMAAEFVIKKMLDNTVTVGDMMRLKKCRERLITASAYAKYGIDNDEFVTSLTAHVRNEDVRGKAQTV
jgi:hypothetical protein